MDLTIGLLTDVHVDHVSFSHLVSDKHDQRGTQPAFQFLHAVTFPVQDIDLTPC